MEDGDGGERGERREEVTSGDPAEELATLSSLWNVILFSSFTSESIIATASGYQVAARSQDGRLIQLCTKVAASVLTATSLVFALIGNDANNASVFLPTEKKVLLLARTRTDGRHAEFSDLATKS